MGISALGTRRDFGRLLAAQVAPLRLADVIHGGDRDLGQLPLW